MKNQRSRKSKGGNKKIYCKESIDAKEIWEMSDIDDEMNDDIDVSGCAHFPQYKYNSTQGEYEEYMKNKNVSESYPSQPPQTRDPPPVKTQPVKTQQQLNDEKVLAKYMGGRRRKNKSKKSRNSRKSRKSRKHRK